MWKSEQFAKESKINDRYFVGFVEDDEGSLELRSRRVLKIFNILRYDFSVGNQIPLGDNCQKARRIKEE